MNTYDYMKALEEEAHKAKKRYNTRRCLVTAQAWNENAHGSAPCARGSLELAQEAYAEYKQYNEW